MRKSSICNDWRCVRDDGRTDTLDKKNQRAGKKSESRRAELRKEWIGKFKANFRAQLDNIEFVDEQ